LLLGANYDVDIDKRRIGYSYAGAPANLLSIDGRPDRDNRSPAPGISMVTASMT